MNKGEPNNSGSFSDCGEVEIQFDVYRAYNNLMIASVRSLGEEVDAGLFDISIGNNRDEVEPRVVFFDWFFRNYLNLFSVYQRLGSANSKNLFMRLIIYRLVGHGYNVLPPDYWYSESDYKQYVSAEVSAESPLKLRGMFGKLKHYDFKYKEKHYIADCVSLEYYLLRRQYFFNKDGIDVSPQPGDRVIDGGACTGDTTLVFSNAVGPAGYVYSFDPVSEHLDLLDYNTRRFTFNNTKIMPYGLSDRNVESAPIILDQYAPGFRVDGKDVPLRSIDMLVSKEEISSIDFIKLDIEGEELNALKGAMQSIDRFHPKLAISLYHKPNDVFEIPNFISDKFPFYKLYIDHYTNGLFETVLYCIA
jgi:FkbM family methyltransferase